MKHYRFAIVCGLLGAALAWLPADSSAQDQSIDYKALYEAADYENALVVLSTLDTVDAQQYKTLCLLALGRQEDARAAAQVLVMNAPTYLPSSEDLPPRFVEVVIATRRSLLPGIARQTFGLGREEFAAKHTENAIMRFNLVLTLVADPHFEDRNAAQDLRTLAQGFIDLAQAAVAPAPAPEPAPVNADVQTTPPIATPAQAAQVAPAPRTIVPPPLSSAGQSQSVPKVTQATVLDQRVPPIPSEVVGRLGPQLIVSVQIDATGKVSSAAIQQSAHPLFDRLVLLAAREWRYTPATLNGIPVPSERVVTIQTR